MIGHFRGALLSKKTEQKKVQMPSKLIEYILFLEVISFLNKKTALMVQAIRRDESREQLTEIKKKRRNESRVPNNFIN